MNDCVASLHTNPWTCGIAKFNHALAAHLGVPLVPLASLPHSRYGSPLLSISCAEFGLSDSRLLSAWLDQSPLYDVLLHSVTAHDMEALLVRGSRRRFGATRSIARAIGGVGLWCPSTVQSEPAQQAPVRILTFGMAHKLKLDHYRKLRQLMNGLDYQVDVSTALHEDTPWQQAVESLTEDLYGIFPARVAFLGYLGDAALMAQLSTATAVAAFFPQGVRENNTTVWAAMSAGVPVITNVDAASAPVFVHGATIFDIAALTEWPSEIERGAVARTAFQMAQTHSWEALIGALRCES